MALNPLIITNTSVSSPVSDSNNSQAIEFPMEIPSVEVPTIGETPETGLGSDDGRPLDLDPGLINIDDSLSNPVSNRPSNLSGGVSDNAYLSIPEDRTSFTSTLLNIVEPYDVEGTLKTAFYSEIGTNFYVGDKVFISNGFYDSQVKIAQDVYSKGVDGYEILVIEGCKIVLDIDYTGNKPFNGIETDDFLFVHNVTTQAEFDYVSSMKASFLDERVKGTVSSIFMGFNNGTGGGKFDYHYSFSGNIIRTTLSSFQVRNFDSVSPLSFGDYYPASYNSFIGGDFWFNDFNDTKVWEELTDFFRNNRILIGDKRTNPSQEVGNKKVYILGKDFVFDGVIFKEGVVYSFNSDTSKWEQDKSYKPAIISKLYFIDGTFTGNHKSGLFGSYNKQNVWEGKGDWQGGSVINTIWKSGKMDSKTKAGDRILRASINEKGEVVQSVDTTNNSGTGYSEIIDSVIEAGLFYEGNFKNCILGRKYEDVVDIPLGSIPAIGAYPNFVLDDYFNNISTSFSLQTVSSSLRFCDVYDTLLTNTTLYDSFVKNCKLFGSKSVNNQLSNVLFDNGEYNCDVGITIVGAELNSYDKDFTTQNNFNEIWGVLKLFISDKDFFRMSKGDTFYIEKVNKEYFFNSIDEHFRIHLPYETKFLLDLYWDYEFSYDYDGVYPNTVSVRDKRSNRYKYNIEVNKDAALTITKPQPRSTGLNPLWDDITSSWKGLFDPAATYQLTDLFYFYEKQEPEKIGKIPGDSEGSETYHIFTKLTPLIGEVLSPVPTIDGWTRLTGWNNAHSNSFGPDEPTSPGQYRGEFSTDPSDIATFPAGGKNYYQKNDVVFFFNPQTLAINFYRAKVDITENLFVSPNAYTNAVFTLAAQNVKKLVVSKSDYDDYCSIVIESKVLANYFLTQGGVRKCLAPVKKFTDPKFVESDQSLMPIDLVDKIFKGIQIKNAHFQSGVFINSDWVSGSYINDYQNIIFNDRTIPSLSIFGGPPTSLFPDLTFEVGLFSDYNTNPKLAFEFGDYIWVDPITYKPASGSEIELFARYKLIQNGINISGQFRAVTLKLDDDSYTQFSSGTSDTFTIKNSPLATHPSIYPFIIENSTIYGGKFRRVLFKNSTFKTKSDYKRPDTLIIDPQKVPLLMNIIFYKNGAKVENGFIYQSQLLDLNITGGHVYYSYVNGATVNGGEFEKVYWVDATMDGGKFVNNLGTIAFTNPIEFDYVERTFLAINDLPAGVSDWWYRGLFLSGEFYNSKWIDGNFRNGKFWKSTWYGGTWSNGILGDSSINYQETKFGAERQQKIGTVWLGSSYSNWYDGECQNALVGGLGRVSWEGGRMIGGEFTSQKYDDDVYSVWYDGIFDGSVFTNLAKWKNGTFNNGKFQSRLGSDLMNFEDTLPIYGNMPPDPDNVKRWTIPNDWGWENGVFNGGEFGTRDKRKSNNSIWFNGQFNGGFFGGRIWRNGIFTGGKFYGSGNQEGGNLPIKSLDDNYQEKWFFWSYTNELLFNGNGHIDLNQNLRPVQGDFYGLWFDGIVLENSADFNTNEKNETKITRATDIKVAKVQPTFENILWHRGTFSHESGTLKDSLFLSGNFVRGYFDGGVFNPYVDRGFNYGSTYGFSFSEVSNIKWTNGTFVTGSFFASTWENGTFKDGLMFGAHWKDGTWEYGRANNILWTGGVWKNGNWYGAPFTSSQVGVSVNAFPGFYEVNIGRSLDIIKITDRFMSSIGNQSVLTGNISYLYISNVFSASAVTVRNVEMVSLRTDLGDSLGFQIPQDVWTYSIREQYGSYGPEIALRTTSTVITEHRCKNFYPGDPTGILGCEVYACSDGSSDPPDGNPPAVPIPLSQACLLVSPPGPSIAKQTVTTTTSPFPTGKIVYRGLTRSSWGETNRFMSGEGENYDFTYWTGLVNIVSDTLGKTYSVPVTRSINKNITPTGWEKVRGVITARSLTSSLPPVVPSPPYQRGYNVFDKGPNITSESDPTKYNPGNTFGFAPSQRLFARLNGTTSIFTGSNTYYKIEMLVGVELEKEVSFDVWVGGLSYSTFNLPTWEFYYYSPLPSTQVNNGQTTNFRLDYILRFYKLTFVYFKTQEFDTVTDSQILWVRKESFGRLTIYRWRLTQQTVYYDEVFTNFLYPGVERSFGMVRLPGGLNIKYDALTRQNYPISLNFGNGYFKQGIWESGVWNSGWRANGRDIGYFTGDDTMRANRLISAVRGGDDSNWIITLGFVDDLSDYLNRGYNLIVGAKVAVGNLASYDSTNKRRVINSIFDVIDIDYVNRIVKVLYKTQIQISYITQDSFDHYLYLTTNIWKNGAFLNGVFRGVWNNGAIVGNPKHTKMYDTQFISGYFDGAYFISNFVDDGILRYQTGLIQDFTFVDRNIATRGKKFYKSRLELNYFSYSRTHLKKSGSVFRTRLFRPQAYGLANAVAPSPQKWFSPPNSGSTRGITVSNTPNVPNLFGNITTDVLKSSSSFRDFGTLNSRVYSLGLKKTRYSNILPNDGNFVLPISSEPLPTGAGGVSPFNITGLTFALIRQQTKTMYPGTQSPFTFSISSNTNDQNSGLLQISALDASTYSHDYTFLLRNTNVPTIVDRYYEFSMTIFEQGILPGSIYMDDVIQFLSTTSSQVSPAPPRNYVGDFLTSSSAVDAVNNYVNHAVSPFAEKVEYFFNKANVDILFEIKAPGTQTTITTQALDPADFPPGPSAIYIENISLYEVDMIPFFSYFTAGELDQSINTQYAASAPKIEFTNKDFDFVDDSNLTITYELLLSQNPAIPIINPAPTTMEVKTSSVIDGLGL